MAWTYDTPTRVRFKTILAEGYSIKRAARVIYTIFSKSLEVMSQTLRRDIYGLRAPGASALISSVVNPPRVPRTPSALRRVIQDSQDDDVIMVNDGSQAGTASEAVYPVADAAEDPESPSNGRERARYAIPTTVVLRKDSQKSIREAPIEHSWTLFYYTISELSSTWLKKFKKAMEEVYDRLCTCNYCE
ncbi:hypothetical protein IFR05_015487 [Cadophora sp. M221]|nr:hypothetical protein IFR05_015487 [Cadophora sp. M221]